MYNYKQGNFFFLPSGQARLYNYMYLCMQCIYICLKVMYKHSNVFLHKDHVYMYLCKQFIYRRKLFKTNKCLKETDLVRKEDPLLRIVILWMNPWITFHMNRAIREAIKDNILKIHLLVVLILHINSPNLSKIYWNFKTWFILHHSVLFALRPVCVTLDCVLL